ncbi:unnamed protein product [Calypogeia fissa]
MAEDGGGDEHLFLGEAQWEYMPGGRVRCVQTGHEMPLSAQPSYAVTKKCRSALFDAALQKRTPPLNFFEQSPVAKDKIVCKLTGVVLNKKEDAVWKHMLGKKFEQRLAEKEAEKGVARKDVEMTEHADNPSFNNDVDHENPAKDEDKAKRKKKGKILADEQEADKPEAAEQEMGEGSSDGSDFWVPPAGDRWDFDNGNNDRWSELPSHIHPENNKGVQINGHTNPTASGNGSSFSNGDTEMLDGEEDLPDSANSDDSEEKISTKRMSTSSLPRSQKKRAKRLKGGRNQNGV